MILNKCKYLSKGFNNKLKCKYNKRHIISLDECKNCPNFILMRNKPIRKVSSKKKYVSKETYQKVYERDKGRCRLCGNNNIQLHHIVYRSEDKSLIDEPTNCIMLCYKCHKLVHSNKHLWKPKLQEMINNGIFNKL